MSEIELIYIDDHASLMVSDLLFQFRDKPRINALVKANAAAVQVLEDEIYILMADTALESASGHQLEQIGAYIGEKKGDLTDPEYRLAIIGRAATIRSEGSTDEMINVLRLMLPFVSIKEITYKPLSVVITVVLKDLLSANMSKRVNSIMETARPMGIRVDIVQAPIQYFGWAGDNNATGWNAGGFSGVIK